MKALTSVSYRENLTYETQLALSNDFDSEHIAAPSSPMSLSAFYRESFITKIPAVVMGGRGALQRCSL